MEFGLYMRGYLLVYRILFIFISGYSRVFLFFARFGAREGYFPDPVVIFLTGFGMIQFLTSPLGRSTRNTKGEYGTQRAGFLNSLLLPLMGILITRGVIG